MVKSLVFPAAAAFTLACFGAESPATKTSKAAETRKTAAPRGTVVLKGARLKIASAKRGESDFAPAGMTADENVLAVDAVVLSGKFSEETVP